MASRATRMEACLATDAPRTSSETTPSVASRPRGGWAVRRPAVSTSCVPVMAAGRRGCGRPSRTSQLRARRPLCPCGLAGSRLRPGLPPAGRRAARARGPGGPGEGCTALGRKEQGPPHPCHAGPGPPPRSAHAPRWTSLPSSPARWRPCAPRTPSRAACETFGALVTGWQARTANDAEVRRALGPISRDELRHAELAWAVDAWAAGRLTAPAREHLRQLRRQELRLLEQEVASQSPRAPGA